MFDLPATQYPGLDSAVVVMQQLREIFTIYQQLRVSTCEHSQLFFIDLPFCLSIHRIMYFFTDCRNDLAYNALGYSQAG